MFFGPSTNNVLLGKIEGPGWYTSFSLTCWLVFMGGPLYESTNENLRHLRFQRQQIRKSKGDPKGKIKHWDNGTCGNENPGP